MYQHFLVTASQFILVYEHTKQNTGLSIQAISKTEL